MPGRWTVDIRVTNGASLFLESIVTGLHPTHSDLHVAARKDVLRRLLVPFSPVLEERTGATPPWKVSSSYNQIDPSDRFGKPHRRTRQVKAVLDALDKLA